MNKYTIITLLILSVILITILIAFDIEYKWWHFIPVYLISNYNGKVMKQTFQGFNINKISFEETTDETIQIFICDVVTGFTGKSIEFECYFNNELNLDENAIISILTRYAKKDEIIEALQKGNKVSKTYNYYGKNVEITFNRIIQYINNFEK